MLDCVKISDILSSQDNHPTCPLNFFFIKPKKIEILTENELSLLQKLSNALKPVYIASIRMGRNHVNLGTADKILVFMLEKLEALHDNPYAETIITELKARIIERRNSNLSYLCGTLNKDVKIDDLSDYLRNPSFNEMVEYAEKLYNRLFTQKNLEESLVIEDIEEEPKSVEQQLEDYINKKVEYNKDSFKSSFLNFRLTGIIDEKLMDLKSAVNSVHPSSILPERLFSLAGNFVRVRRNRIQSDLLDALIILRGNI